MKTTKKILVSLLVIIVIALSSFALVGFTANTNVYADSEKL